MKHTEMFFIFNMFLLSSCGLQSIPQAENAVEAAFSEIDNQYKRRLDLIPNLVSVVKGYATHESETLEKVIAARAKATQVTIDPSHLSEEKMKEYQASQGQLGQALGRLMMVSEKYPDLKANENFRDLQSQLEGTENRITIARRRYIETVQEFNNLITVFPTSLTNSIFFHKDKKPQFSVAPEAHADQAPKVDFH